MHLYSSMQNFTELGRPAITRIMSQIYGYIVSNNTGRTLAIYTDYTLVHSGKKKKVSGPGVAIFPFF